MLQYFWYEGPIFNRILICYPKNTTCLGSTSLGYITPTTSLNAQIVVRHIISKRALLLHYPTLANLTN